PERGRRKTAGHGGAERRVTRRPAAGDVALAAPVVGDHHVGGRRLPHVDRAEAHRGRLGGEVAGRRRGALRGEAHRLGGQGGVVGVDGELRGGAPRRR